MGTKKVKKVAPLPLITQERVATERVDNKDEKTVTTLTLGPHKIEVIAYPNRGYYINVNGVGGTINQVENALRDYLQDYGL